jgi:hypothetical protein
MMKKIKRTLVGLLVMMLFIGTGSAPLTAVQASAETTASTYLDYLTTKVKAGYYGNSSNYLIRFEHGAKLYDSNQYNKTSMSHIGLPQNGLPPTQSKLCTDVYDMTTIASKYSTVLAFDTTSFDNTTYTMPVVGYLSDGTAEIIYDVDGYDALGYDKDGYNVSGYDIDGYDKAGYNASGYNKDGYDKDGYNASGYDKDGYDKDGYDLSGYNKDGVNKNGLVLDNSAEDATAGDTTKISGSYGYKVKKDGSVEICYYTGSGKKVTIPSKIDGKNVTSIGDNAFLCSDGLTSVTIPNGVTSIGDSAFSSCVDLTSVSISDSVTSIGAEAFSNTSLTSIFIPKGVKSIEGSAFFHCNSMTKIKVSKDNQNLSIINGALYNKKGTKLIWVSMQTKGTFNIPKTVSVIGDWAFSFCCDLTSISIPNSVKSIESNAFYVCDSLTSISIPKSVTSIEDSAFTYCSRLTSIKVDKNNKQFTTKDGALYSNKGTKLLWVSIQKKGSFSIPQNVTVIGDSAFFKCSKLTSISIPNKVTSIGMEAFYGCDGLTKITIPNSVKSIGDHAFGACSHLTSVTLPNKISHIGNNLFSNCYDMTSITIPKSVTSIGYGAFYNCIDLTIHCTSGSVAEQYAKDNDIKYKTK